MTTNPDSGFQVSADELIQVLQAKIGQYEVEKEATGLLLRKQALHINELENRLLQSSPVPTAAE